MEDPKQDAPKNAPPAPDEKTDTRMSVAGWVTMAVLAGCLAMAVMYAVHAWMKLSGVHMSHTGWFFLVAGVVVTIGLGAGLMTLVFYSSRKNFDR